MNSWLNARTLIGLAQIAIAAVSAATATGFIHFDPSMIAAILAVQNVLTGGHRTLTGANGSK